MEYFVIYLLVMADRIVAVAAGLMDFGFLSIISIGVFAISRAISRKIRISELEPLEKRKEIEESKKNGDFYKENDITNIKGHIALHESLQAVLKPVMVITTTIWFMALLISATFPSTKQLAAIIGTGVAYNVVSSDSSKEMAKEAYEIVQLHMRNYIDELRKGLEKKGIDMKKEMVDAVTESVSPKESK